MPATLATADAIMKEVYEKGLAEQLNDEVVGLKRVVKSSDNIETDLLGGKYTAFPLHYGRNQGIGARREYEDLPIPGNQTSVLAKAGLKYQYGGVQASGQVIKLVQTKPQAFTSAIEHETTRLRMDLSVDLNRQVYGNGSGAMMTTSTVGASGTPAITSGVQYAQVGMSLDVYTPANLAANGASKGTVTVTAITDNGNGTGSLTVTPATVSFAANDVFVRNGNANREWLGLGALISDTGQLHAVDPATYGFWKSRVWANGGVSRPISEGLMISAADGVYAQGGRTSLMLTSLGVRRSYFQLLVQQRQIVNQSQEFPGGFKGLSFTTDRGEIPLIADKDCPFGTLYGIDEKHITWYRENDWSWLTYNDSDIWQKIVRKDAWEAFLYQYSELTTDRRNAHYVIRDITEAQ